MIHLVNVSGGNASAVCLFRVIERFGADNVIARFADTKSESLDTYRFIDDVERAAGVPILRLADGRTKWDVFHEKAMLTAPKEQGGGCMASWELKRKMLEAHSAKVASPESCVIYIGFSKQELDRVGRLVVAACRQAFAGGATPWRYDFPLVWPEALDSRCDIENEVRRHGITPCDVYDAGYSHNNCNRACILAGNKQWTGLLKDDPVLFAQEEEEEQKFLAMLREKGRKEHTILTDRRGGERKNLSLKQLREEVEAGIRHHDDSWRETSCSCMLF